MRAENIKFTIDDVQYTWNGGFGSVFYSVEKGLKKGELRAINGTIFRVSRIDVKDFFIFTREVVHWTTVENIDCEWIRKFKLDILGN